MRRASAPRTILPTKRLSKCFSLQEQVYLERAMGYSVQNNAALSLDVNSGLVAYPAGCVIVLFNTRRNKQSFIRNEETKAFTAVCFSRDGKLLATGESGYRPMVRVWSVEERTQQCYFAGHNFRVECVQFSPTSLYLVSVGSQEDHSIHVWDVRMPARLASSNISSKINALAFSEDGQFFVTVGVRSVRFWYMDTSKIKLKETIPLQGRNAILREFIHSVFTDVACCTEGNNPTGTAELSQTFTYALTQDGQLCKFNAQRNLLKWVNFKTPRATSLSLTDHYILVGCAGGICIVFHTPTLNYITRLPFPHALGVDLQEEAFQLPPTSQVSTSYSSTGSISGEETGPNIITVHHPFSTQRREGATYPDIIAARYDHRHSRVTCCYADHSLYVWDIRDIKHVQKHISHLYHSGPIWSIEVLPFQHVIKEDSDPANSQGHLLQQPNCFVTGSDDDTLRMWCLPPQNSMNDSNNPTLRSSTNLSSIASFPDNPYSQDLKKIVYLDPCLTCLATVDKHPVSNITERGDEQRASDAKPGLRAVDISPDGSHLAAGDKQGNVRIFLFDGFEEFLNIPAHESEVLCLNYFQSTSIPDLRLLCSSSRDRLIHIYDVASDYTLVQTLDDHSGAVYSAKIVETSDGNIRLLSCGGDKSFLFHILKRDENTNSARFQLAYHLVGKNSQQDLCLTHNFPSLYPSMDSLTDDNRSKPDVKHTLVGVAYQDRTVRVYNVMNGKLRRSMKASKAEDGIILRCTLDPSDTFIATTGSDKVIYLLDFRTGEIKAEFGGHSELILGIRFLPDLKRLVSVSADGCIFIWRIPSQLSMQMRANFHHACGRHANEEVLSQQSTMPITTNHDLPVGIPIHRPSTVEIRDKSQSTVTRDNADPHSNESFRFSVSALPEWAKKNLMLQGQLDDCQNPPVMDAIEGSPVLPSGSGFHSLLSTPKVVAEDDPDNIEEDADEHSARGKCSLEFESTRTYSIGDDDDDDICCTPVSECGFNAAAQIPAVSWNNNAMSCSPTPVGHRGSNRAGRVVSSNTQILLEQLSSTIRPPGRSESAGNVLEVGASMSVSADHATIQSRQRTDSVDVLSDEEGFVISPPTIMTNSAPCVLAEVMQRSRLHFPATSDVIVESTENVFESVQLDDEREEETEDALLEGSAKYPILNDQSSQPSQEDPRTSLSATYLKRSGGAALNKTRVGESSENLSRTRHESLNRAAQDTKRRLHKLTPHNTKPTISYGVMGPPQKPQCNTPSKKSLPKDEVKRAGGTSKVKSKVKVEETVSSNIATTPVSEKRGGINKFSASRTKSVNRINEPGGTLVKKAPIVPPPKQITAPHSARNVSSSQQLISPKHEQAAEVAFPLETVPPETVITVHTPTDSSPVVKRGDSCTSSRRRWKRDSSRTCPVDMDAYQKALQMTRKVREVVKQKTEESKDEIVTEMEITTNEFVTLENLPEERPVKNRSQLNKQPEVSASQSIEDNSTKQLPKPSTSITSPAISHILVREALEKIKQAPVCIESGSTHSDVTATGTRSSRSAESFEKFKSHRTDVIPSFYMKQSSREHVIDAEESGEDDQRLETNNRGSVTSEILSEYPSAPLERNLSSNVLPRDNRTRHGCTSSGSQGQLMDMAGLLDEILAKHRNSGPSSRRPSSATILNTSSMQSARSNSSSGPSSNGTYNVNSPTLNRLSGGISPSVSLSGRLDYCSGDDKTPIPMGRNSLPPLMSSSIMYQSTTSTIMDNSERNNLFQASMLMSASCEHLPVSDSLHIVAQQLNTLVARCNQLEQLECERARNVLLQEIEPQFLALKLRLGLSLNLHVLGREHLESIIHEISQYMRNSTTSTVALNPPSRIPAPSSSDRPSTKHHLTSRQQAEAE